MKRLSRRTLLRAGGYALALPWLEATAQAATTQAAPTPAARALFVYFPSGYTKGHWVAPGDKGGALTLPPLARALEPFRSKLTLVSGLGNHPASVYGDDAGGLHARGTGCALVCEPLAQRGGFRGAGVSVDQVIAQELGQKTCISSLVLGVPNERVPSFAEEGYGSIYYNNVSFTGPRSPVQKLSDPADLFLRLVTCPGFGARTRGGGGRARFEASVMGTMKDEAKRLAGCVSQADRVRLDEYFTAVSELERRFLPAAPAACPGLAAAPAPGVTLAEGARAMMDLTVLAFQCGLTRVGTLMMDGAFSRRDFGLPELGGVNYIHGLSHGEIGGTAADDPRWLRITRHYFELFAYLLGRLDALPDGPGGTTLLDTSVVSFGSEFGDGNTHQCTELPLVLAGGGNGRLTRGRHLAAAQDLPIANAWLDILHAMGSTRTRFGDSTGGVPGLLAPD